MAKVQDFGEKIGGSKKDLWSKRGYMSTDLDTMSAMEMIKVVTKTNVWPEPNYAEMYKEGAYREDLYFLHQLYKSLGASVTTNDAERIKEIADTYVKFLLDIKVYMLEKIKMKQMYFGRTLIEWLMSNGYLEHVGSSGVYGRWSLITKCSMQPAINRTFVSFINDCLNYKQWYPNEIDEKELRGWLTQIQTDDVKRKEWYQKVLKSTNVCRTFFSGLYASGFPVETEKALMNIQVHIYKEASYIDIKGNTICKKLNVPKGTNVIDYIIDGSVRQDYKELVQIAKKNKDTVIDGNRSIEKKEVMIRVELPNQYVLRNGPKVRRGDAKIESLLYNKDNKNITFGFRGGEFGNWQNKRQECLNCTIDALSDLAYVLDYPYAAMSLGFTGTVNDKLAIAWGARGSGKASAHYEPLRTVINLTKLHGAGTLAHEWGHALDDACGRWYGFTRVSKDETTNFLSMHIGNIENVAETEAQRAVREAFANVINALIIKEVIMTDAERKKMIDQNLQVYGYKVKKILHHIEITQQISTGLLDITHEQYEKLLLDILKNKYTASEVTQKFKENGLMNSYYVQHSSTLENSLNIELHELQKKIQSVCAQTTKTQTTDYCVDARHLDAMRSKPYYTTAVELFARAFESYVEDKLGTNVSQYLVYGTQSEIYKSVMGASPYPQGEERRVINATIQVLIDTIRKYIIKGNFPVNLKRHYQQAQKEREVYFEEPTHIKEEIQASLADAQDTYKNMTAESNSVYGRTESWEQLKETEQVVKDKQAQLKAMQEGLIEETNDCIDVIIHAWKESLNKVCLTSTGDTEIVQMSAADVNYLLNQGVIRIVRGGEILPRYIKCAHVTE
jgi:hypothetical protein